MKKKCEYRKDGFVGQEKKKQGRRESKKGKWKKEREGEGRQR